jgi:2,5-diamino-6-(ribosylamino)-4(3H)-pyrimidinone 5'-phosphate reductase
MAAQRPYVIVNVAMSVDGKIDTIARKGATISSAADKSRVDQLRAAVDAVMVGGRTLIHEDPKLTVKSAQLRLKRKARGLEENPAKVGVVTLADLRPEGRFMTAGPARRLIFTTRRTSPELVSRLETAGAQVFVHGRNGVDLSRVMKSLPACGIRKLMVEGGGTLIAECFRLGFVDEVYAYVAPVIFAGAMAPTLADGPGFLQDRFPRLQLISVEKLDEDGGVLIHYSFPHKG